MKSETFTFAALPKNVAELKALPESDLNSPFKTAALTVAVLNHYCENVEETIEMINFLKGPQPLSPYDIQFLRDRLKGRDYVPRSYFEGTSPANNYTPTQPYTVIVSDGIYSYSEEGYVELFIRSSGADSPRKVKLRRKGEQWFLWANFLLPDIRKPAEQDPWA